MEILSHKIITDTGNDESYYKYTVHNCITLPSLIWQRSFTLQSSGLQQQITV